MKRLLLFTIIGFVAQLIDGSLGMAYGVTSTSLILSYGIAPAVASASVHVSEVVTTAASGISHLKFGNVDKQTALKLIIPGSIGAFSGACFLSNLPGGTVKPYISIFLLLLGLYVFFRFLFKWNEGKEKKNLRLTKLQSIFLGLFAGFADATGGGGWGPIATPALLSREGIPPRKVIGTVDTSEFAIAISATLGFMISLGWEQVNWVWVIALMAGGVIAAPIAAWLVKRIPSYILGVLVGGFIILTNAQTVLYTWFIKDLWHILINSFIVSGWVAGMVFVIWKNKKVV